MANEPDTSPDWRGTPEHFQQVADLSARSIAARHAWTRTVLTIITGTFAAIVSLHNDRADDVVEHVLFITALAALALNILVGVVCLYSEVAQPMDMAVDLIQANSKRHTQGESGPVVVTKQRPHLKLSKKSFPWLIGLSFGALLAYAVAADRPFQAHKDPEVHHCQH